MASIGIDTASDKIKMKENRNRHHHLFIRCDHNPFEAVPLHYNWALSSTFFSLFCQLQIQINYLINSKSKQFYGDKWVC